MASFDPASAQFFWFHHLHLPAWKDPSPSGIHVFSHFRLIIALAIAAPGITLSTACQLVAIQLHSQTRLFGNADAPIHEGNPAAHNYFVLAGLPGIVRVTGITQVRRRRGGMGHGHQGNTQVSIRMHGKTQPKTSAKLSQMLCLPQAAPVVRIGEHDLSAICSDRLSEISKRSYGNVAG